MSAFFIDALRRRMRAMNTLWERAARELTLAQINHHERPGVLPMAFGFSHVFQVQDTAISVHFLGEEPLWTAGRWAARIGVAVDREGRGEAVATMELQRFADLEAWRGYQAAVIARTDAVLAAITVETLMETAIPALPESMRGSYCSLVAGMGNPVSKLDLLECNLYQHGLRHMGEVEHARALLGLAGSMTG